MGMLSDYSKYVYEKQKEAERKQKIKNIKYHPENFSIDLSNARYILKTKSVVGNIRDNNEDNATIMISPYDEEIKLLAVCDGLGGLDCGELASKIAIYTLQEWFLKNDFSKYDNNQIKKSIAYAIGLANYNIIIEQNKKNKEYKEAGKYEICDMATTLTMALITSEKTYIANVGDSRTYELINDRLIQVTEDDSYVWDRYKNDGIKKDDLRFEPGNNIVSKCLGQDKNLGSIKISTINNNYKSLLLFSDGVTDILSDSDIKNVIDTTDKKDIIDGIIYDALNIENDDLKDCGIKPGKDNTTVALYIKK